MSTFFSALHKNLMFFVAPLSFLFSDVRKYKNIFFKPKVNFFQF